jgi:hypothetical protein
LRARRGKGLSFIVEVIWEKRVNRFHFFAVEVSRNIVVKLVNYLKRLLVPNIFIAMVVFGNRIAF